MSPRPGSGAPLAGERVVITRAEHQTGPLAGAFEAAGARVERLPLIELAPPADPGALHRAARDLAGVDWLVFTSSNAVDAFLPSVKVALRARVAVIGPATAAAVRRHGGEPAVEAESSHAEGLLARLAPHLEPGSRVLVPQAADARPALVAGLCQLDADVVQVEAYRKRLPAAAQEAARKLFGDAPIGWVTVTSPRIARHLASLFGDGWERRRRELRALSIGGVTSAELVRLGVEPAAQAARPTGDCLVAAMIGALAGGSAGTGSS